MMNVAAIESARILVDLAFQEDLLNGSDVTSENLIPSGARGTAKIVSREPGKICGTEIIPLIIERFHADFTAQIARPDSSEIPAGTVAAILHGRTIDILKAERTILNFMGHLSGIATLTHRFVEQTAGTPARIFDTRKTTPGWRILEKYAVTCGGGTNHRMGLYDAVLIKDNHLAAVAEESPGEVAWIRRVENAISTLRSSHAGLTIQVEVDTLKQFQQVLPLRPDIVLLDNMSTADLATAVQLRGKAPVELEASGGVNLQTVAAIAQTGVDRISVGALTHSAVNFDWGLDWDSK